MLMPSSLRLFVCRQPADMRKSFDGLSNLCREHLREDPRRVSGKMSSDVSSVGNRVVEGQADGCWNPQGQLS